MPRFKLFLQSDPECLAEFFKEKVSIGRARTNDYVIEDGTVSRNQATITFASDKYRLTNIGSAPVLVNGQMVMECVLKSGDVISFGYAKYVFEQLDEPEDNDSEEETLYLPIQSDFDQTLVGNVPAILTVTSGEDWGQTFVLNKKEFVIGRSVDCDLVLPDRHVSRKHVVIENREGEYFLVKVSSHQVVLVNGTAVEEARLFNSDQIDIFTSSFTFKSTNPKDQRNYDESPAPLKSSREQKKPPPVPQPEVESFKQDDEPQIKLKPKPELKSEAEPPISHTVIAEPRVQANETIIQPRIVAKKLGPRLVSHSGDGKNKNYPLRSGRNVIGRGPHCEIGISGDNSVSRSHGEIEKKEDGHYVTPLSDNPILLNGKKIKSELRVYNGDNIQVGGVVLTFISEGGEDERPVTKKHSALLLSLVVVLVLGLAGVLSYRFVWEPYQVNTNLAVAQTHLENKEFSHGLALLRELFKVSLTEEQRQKVLSGMVTSIIGMVDIELGRDQLDTAKFALEVFLRQYGAEDKTTPVWDKLNEVRYLSAERLFQAEQLKLALNEYLTIDSDSQYYKAAQKAISDIWLKSQAPEPTPAEKEKKEDVVPGLLAEAEALFAKKHYLSPLNNNAYALYAKVLLIEPGNAVALDKIEKMKTFYQFYGSKYCSQGNKSVAETYFRRFLIIDPENSEVQQQLMNVDQCESASVKLLTAKKAEKPTVESSAQPSAQEGNKQKIRSLLEEEGLKSEWVVDYLFSENPPEDEREDSDKQETPW